MIYFDITYLHYDDQRGICQVVRRLLELLIQEQEFKKIKLIATGKVYKKFKAQYSIPDERFAIVRIVPFIEKFERFHGLFSDLRYLKIKRNARLIIHPENRSVVNLNIPQAVMFHDLIEFEPVEFSGDRKWDRFLYFYYKCRRASKCKYIWTNSEFTKHKLLNLFPEAKKSSISVLPLAAREDAGLAASPKSLPQDAPVKFLYVGAFERRKNVSAMIEWFKTAEIARGNELHLVGNKTSPSDNELLADRLIKYHGKVSDDELRKFYYDCHFFLFPSLMEGFGLPIIEAMSNGLVVCAFDNSSIPEVCGDTAILKKNNDFVEWGTSIETLIKNKPTYTSFSEKSLQQANVFSQKVMMKRYSDYFKSIISSELSD